MHHSETHYEKTDKRRENTKQNTKNTKKVKDNKNAAAAHYFRDWLMRNFYFSLNLYGSRMFMNASFSMKYQHFCLNDVFLPELSIFSINWTCVELCTETVHLGCFLFDMQNIELDQSNITSNTKFTPYLFAFGALNQGSSNLIRIRTFQSLQ